jgi:hypothetical protein
MEACNCEISMLSPICFIGLFITLCCFISRSKCYRPDRNRCRDCCRKRLIGFKIYHVFLVALGYLWVLGIIYGCIMWIITFICMGDEDLILDEDAFPLIRKISRTICGTMYRFFTTDISFKIKWNNARKDTSESQNEELLKGLILVWPCVSRTFYKIPENFFLEFFFMGYH